MALTLYSGWDLARRSVTVAGSDDGGAFSGTLTLSSGTYAHVDLQSATGTGTYDDWATRMATFLNDVSGGAGTYTVTWSTAQVKYTIDYDNGNFSLTFASFDVTTATGHLAAILGFSSNRTGAASYSSQITPYYAIATTAGGKSRVEDDYEPDGVATDSEADSGASFGISRTTSPKYHDFALPIESKAKTYKRSAAAVPWTYEHFWEHARTVEPFSLYDGTNHEVFRLRADGASFRPQRVIADVDTLWDIPFRCRLVGRI